MVQEEHLSEIYKYVLSLSACHDTALENYIKTASQGKVYEYMQEVINKRENVNLKRDDIKTMILTTLFSKNRFMPTYKKYFKQNFPQIYELIRLVKKENHETLACILQNIESEIILHRCCCQIWNISNHQVPVFTIHDSICTTIGNEVFVKEIMIQELTKAVGEIPFIKNREMNKSIKLNEKLECKGYWWLPSKPENKIAGILTYTPNEKIKLELIGSFDSKHIDILFCDKKTDENIIHGITSDSKKVTLINCHSYASLNLSCPFPIVNYNCQFLILGKLLKDFEEECFYKAYVTIPELSHWCSPCALTETMMEDKQNEEFATTISFKSKKYINK